MKSAKTGLDSWGLDNWVVCWSVDSGCHNKKNGHKVEKRYVGCHACTQTKVGRNVRLEFCEAEFAICVTKLEITLLSIKGSPRCV